MVWSFLLSLSASVAAEPSPSIANCPVVSGVEVAIYGGSGPTSECKQWEASFYSWLGLKAVSLSAAQLKDPACGGRLSQLGVKIWVQPGGNAYNTQLSVESVGKQHILNFIDAGGLFVGTCAGFYFAASSYFWQVGYPDGGQFKWPNLLGRFPEVEGSITNIVDDYAHPGYKLTGLDNGLHAIYWGGPTRGWRNTPSAGAPGQVLLRYTDVPGNLMAATHVNGSSGNLLLFSAHLEAIPGVGISNTGLTKTMQLENWQYRGQQISAAAGLDLIIPETLEAEAIV